MATRKERTRHPPTWFKLDSYAVLLEVTNNQLCEEAFYRAYKLTHFCDLSNLITRLASGQICLFHEPRNRVLEAQSDAQLPPSQFIRPISIMELDNIHQLIEKQFPATIQDEKDRFANGEPALVNLHASVAAAMPHHVTQVLNNIDLSAADEDILADLKALLPIWREQLGCPQPNQSKRNSIIKNIIEQNIIPMLDLMLWARHKGFQYTDEQLADILYPSHLGNPDNPITAKHISDTRRPNALKFAEHDYQDAIRRWCDQGHGTKIVKHEFS